MSELSRAIARHRRQMAARDSEMRRRLTDAYMRAVDDLTMDLDTVTRMIADARADGVDVNPDWLRRQDRYRTLIAQADMQFRRFADEGMRILHAGRVRAVSGGAAEAWELADAAGIPRVGFGANINTRSVERVLAALGDTSPVRRVLDRYGEDGARIIDQHLTQGIIQGKSPREVVRAIQRDLKSPYNKARLEALARTEMMRAHRASMFDQYRAMGLTQWRWTAAHSARTCLACLARSGKVYSMKYAFMPAHVCCRCVPTPVAPSVAVESGEAWFARQPEDVRRKMMPSADAADAFERGDVRLSDFVGHRESKVWGRSIRQRSGREVLEKANR